MNREFEKLLKEKWFLVAADLIAVMAILIAMPDKRDGLDTFLVICAILAASLIVVIPVLKDGGGKAERQAEQARLRAKLAEEIDLQRDNIRAGNEAMNRRIVEAEMTARKAAESSAAAVAQRASTEINTLKAALAEWAGRSRSPCPPPDLPKPSKSSPPRSKALPSRSGRSWPTPTKPPTSPARPAPKPRSPLSPN